MKPLRPSTTVLSGAAIGLVAAVAVYGAVSTASAAQSTSFAKSTKPAVVTAPTTAATAASCAAGSELEDGVCVVHVERIVVRPAPSTPTEDPTTAPVPGATHEVEHSTGPSESGEHATEVETADAAEAAADATEAATEAAKEAADHASEAAKEAADHAREAAAGAGQTPSVEPSGNDSPDTSGG